MRIKNYVISILLLANYRSNSQVISMFAGGGIGVGHSADSAFLSIGSIFADSIGNIYNTDGLNRVEKIGNTGFLSLIAADGDNGSSGDGGPAVYAELGAAGNAWSFLVYDKIGGNLYISDCSNNRIRKVNSSGIISTVAGNGIAGSTGDGGLATGAEISPQGIALDNSGNLYVAAGARIRKVTPLGIITTIAGTGTAGFSGDGGLATFAEISAFELTVDDTGNVYFTDAGYRVRKVTHTGYIYSVISTGSTSHAFEGITLDTSGRSLYVCDAVNNQVFNIDISTGSMSVFAGNGVSGYSGDGGPATTASLTGPASVTLDKLGNVYITDGASRIRMVSSSGVISTKVNAVDFPLNNGDGRPATDAVLSYPKGIATDRFGNVYISEGNGLPVSRYDNVRKVDIYGTISTIAGCDSTGFSGDGGPATLAKLSDPRQVAVDSAGNIFIADYGNNRIRKVNTAGIIYTIAGGGSTLGDGGPATTAQVSPLGIAVDKFGNIFELETNRVRKIDVTGMINTYAGDGTPGFGGDGNVGFLAQLNDPTGIAVDDTGNLYVADMLNSRVRKVNTTGIISTYANSPDLSTIAIDKIGNVYVNDILNHLIRKIDTSGISVVYAGDGTPGCSGDGGLSTLAELTEIYPACGIALDDTGNLYLSDYLHQFSVVRKIRSESSILSNPVDLFSDAIVLRPNPCNDQIEIYDYRKLFNSFSISDIFGHVLLYQNMKTQNIVINTNFLIPGIYYIRFNGMNGMAIRRFVKVN